MPDRARRVGGDGRVDRLILESCDQDHQDRLPDVIALACGRGGEWRTRVSTVITSVRTCS